MQRVRVLHVHTLPVVSGSGINTYLSMAGLPAARYRMEIACAPGGALLDMIEADGMTVHPVQHLVQPIAPVRDVLALVSLVQVMRRGKYHIVHTHNSKAGFLGRLAARIAGVPVIIHTVHGFSFHQSESAPRRRLFRALERMAAGWCHHMIFISRPLVEWARREGVLKDGQAHSVIYSGINLERFHPVTRSARRHLRRRFGMPPDAPVVGMISKLWPGKGHEVLLRAFAALRERMPRARLLIVGEGDERAHLSHMAKRLGIGGAVVFTGFMSAVEEGIGACDVTVLPSFFEGMGRVLLESMAMGVPVVASNVGGIPDIVHHLENGLLVPPGDARALSRALHYMLRDTNRLATYGQAGRRSVLGRHSSEMMCRAIEDVYRRHLREKGLLP